MLDEAEAAFEKSLSSNPEGFLVNLNYGTFFLFSRGWVKKAVLRLEKAYDLNP